VNIEIKLAKNIPVYTLIHTNNLQAHPPTILLSQGSHQQSSEKILPRKMSWLGPSRLCHLTHSPSKTPYNAACMSGMSMRMTREDVSCIFVESVIEGIWFCSLGMPSDPIVGDL